MVSAGATGPRPIAEGSDWYETMSAAVRPRAHRTGMPPGPVAEGFGNRASLLIESSMPNRPRVATDSGVGLLAGAGRPRMSRMLGNWFGNTVKRGVGDDRQGAESRVELRDDLPAGSGA
jgi:hypothetical protein